MAARKTTAKKRKRRSTSKKSGNKLHGFRNLLVLSVIVLAVLKGVDLANAASEAQNSIGRDTPATAPTASVAGAQASTP